MYTSNVLKGSWDLVTRVITRVTILITPIQVLITLLTKSHDPPSRNLIKKPWVSNPNIVGFI